MIALARAAARLTVLALAAASLLAAGCSTSTAHPCPASLVILRVPTTASNPIVSVSVDPPCTADIDAVINIDVYSREPGTCRGRAQLANGDTYTFSVAFGVLGSGSCAGLAYPVDASVPELISPADGGAG